MTSGRERFALYLDTSALVKLFIDEDGSKPVRALASGRLAADDGGRPSVVSSAESHDPTGSNSPRPWPNRRRFFEAQFYPRLKIRWSVGRSILALSGSPVGRRLDNLPMGDLASEASFRDLSGPWMVKTADIEGSFPG